MTLFSSASAGVRYTPALCVEKPTRTFGFYQRMSKRLIEPTDKHTASSNNISVLTTRDRDWTSTVMVMPRRNVLQL